MPNLLGCCPQRSLLFVRFSTDALPVAEGRMVKIILMIAATLMLWPSNATAQEKLPLGGSCATDLQKLCPGIPPGRGRLRNCFREHIHDVSSPCLVRLAKFAEVRGFHKECSAYLRQQCGSVERSGGQFSACLKSAIASLSVTCKAALARAAPYARSR